ncbi:uncharacterized protein LOC128032572 [Gossypium raimondii]|uniref:uncharacterized protein LOC128032572 n=1 Tax=Gossypium raimondii TaxID=29730 RepID=UPI00227BCFCA|nr:uncharacterized protein LOC128032572 [Gossypium raimondii]
MSQHPSDSDKFVQPAVPHFDGHYDYWSMLMENFLRSKEYWSVVEDGIQELEDSKKKKYQGNVRAKRALLQTLRGGFENLRMKPGETISDYFSKIMTIVNRMRTHREKLEDVAVIERILRFLLPKYNFIICSIEESKYLDALSVDELENSLIIHESKFILQESEEQVLYGHYRSECYTNLNGNSDGGRGHWRGNGRDCGREKVNFAPVTDKPEEEEVTLLMVCDSNEETQKNLWYLDTVKFGDNSLISVQGRGKVKIQTKFSSVQSFCDVFYVPDLKTNLLSVGQLQEKGYEVIIKDGVCKIQDVNLGLIAKVTMTANKNPAHAVQNMTPEEAWSGRQPDVHHFRVFRCVAYSHVLDQKRTKLDDKAENDEITEPAMEQHTAKANQQNGHDCDPVNFDYACKELKWKEAMNDEIVAIEKNNIWELTDLPRG